jgi:hypothetical protein
MLRLLFVAGLFFCRHRHEAIAACFHALRNGSGSFAKLAAMRRASSRVSNFAAEFAAPAHPRNKRAAFQTSAPPMTAAQR